MSKIFKGPFYPVLSRLCGQLYLLCDTIRIKPLSYWLIYQNLDSLLLFVVFWFFWRPVIERIWVWAGGASFLLAHSHLSLCDCRLLTYDLMLARPPWERKRDKERCSLTSFWALSRTVGNSIEGKIQKMVKLHVGSQRDYRELKNRRVRAVETFAFRKLGCWKRWSILLLLLCV